MANGSSNLVFDDLAQFDLGIDSGKDAFLLPKNQLSFAVNATVRGDFVTNRPAFQVQTLSYIGAIQAAVTQSLFQGACYCAPDTGQQQLVAQIGGRLFTFTPDVNDSTVVVNEVTIPGDPNPGGFPQAWLKNAERWVIVNNGVNNPIYYDTTTMTSRRSVPASSSQATTDPTPTAGQFVTPSIGGSITVPLAALGNIAAFINESVQLVEYDNSSPPQVTATTNWEVTSVGGAITTYNVTLKNLGDTPGATQGAGSGLSIQPANIGNIISVISASEPTSPSGFAQLKLGMSAPPPTYLIPGALCSINGDANWFVVSISDSTVAFRYSVPGFNVFASPRWPSSPPGLPVYAVSNTQPYSTVGVLAANFIAPAVESAVAATLVAPYTGAVGQGLFINGRQYEVLAFSTTTGTGTNNVTLLNLNDSRLGHVFNAITSPATTTATQIWNFPELPPGRNLEYNQGRIWEALTNATSFIAGDIVGGPSGSPAYNYRDAILKSSENALIAGGGSFSVPSNLGQITAISGTAQLDASLGQGSLMVVTPGGVFSCNAPTDRTTWSSLTTPILSESLVGLGGLSQNSTVVVNGDLLFRSVDGIRSLIMARRDFWSWGNTPISFEMSRVLDKDNPAGLMFGSAVQFDNRMLMTASPFQGPGGVYNQSFVALNFDPISSLQGKGNSVWDGMWTGINTLQVISGQFSGVYRTFSFTYNTATKAIELYEILKTGSLDNSTTPITWSFETPFTFKQAQGKEFFDLCSLEDGEFYVEDIQPGSTIHFKVQYRPDFSSCWYDWHEFDLCANPNNTANVYGARLGLGKPPSLTPNTVNSTAANFGRWFQYRFTITGHCVWKGMKVSAAVQPQTQFARVISSTVPTPVPTPAPFIPQIPVVVQAGLLVPTVDSSGNILKWPFVDQITGKVVYLRIISGLPDIENT